MFKNYKILLIVFVVLIILAGIFFLSDASCEVIIDSKKYSINAEQITEINRVIEDTISKDLELDLLFTNADVKKMKAGELFFHCNKPEFSNHNNSETTVKEWTLFSNDRYNCMIIVYSDKTVVYDLPSTTISKILEIVSY